MSIYVLDVVLVVCALSIFFTTLQKNHRVHLRRGVCGAVAVALSFWLLSFQKARVIGLVSSLGLVNYLSFLPSGLLTDNVKTALGFLVILVAVLVVYFVILLICKMFSKEGKRFKKDSSYAPVYKPFASFLASLFKVVVFVYVACAAIYVCGGLIAECNIESSIIYPLLEGNGILVWVEEIKEIAQAILG